MIVVFLFKSLRKLLKKNILCLKVACKVLDNF